METIFSIFEKNVLVRLFASAICFYANSIYAAAQSNWSINYWGSVPPSTVFLENDQACNNAGNQSASFLIGTRGNGDAELVFNNKLVPFGAYDFSVGLSSNKKTTVRVFFRRDDFPYETTSIQQVDVSERKVINLRGVYTANGRGSVRIALAETGVKLCIDTPTIAMVRPNIVGSNFLELNPPNSSPVVSSKTNLLQPNIKQCLIEDVFFGVHINKLGVHNNWPSFKPGALRLWDTGTTWALLQPTKNAITWNKNDYAKRLDYYVQHGKSKNLKLQYIYTLGMTPAWAGAKHAGDCNHSSYGSGACEMPANLEDWRKHVRELGNRYKETIKVWELWNEVDQASNWSASPQDMVLMAKIANAELKQIDSNNQIIGPNITIFGLGFLSQFLKAGGGDFVDAFSIHAYVGRSPEKSLNVIRNLQQLLKDHGYASKRIWNTETNVSCNSTLEDCKAVKANSTSIIKGEDALAQGMLGNAALGVENFTYYTWEGASVEDGGQALVQSNFSTPTKTGLVYSSIRSWINGAQLTYLQSDSNRVNIVKVERFGQQAYALWIFKGSQLFDISTLTPVEMQMQASGVKKAIQNKTITVGEEPLLLFPKSFILFSS